MIFVYLADTLKADFLRGYLEQESSIPVPRSVQVSSVGNHEATITITILDAICTKQALLAIYFNGDMHANEPE